jgi:arsenate reductase-like glutaredoxin family protein
LKGNPALDPELRKKNCNNSRKSLELLENAGPDVSFIIENNKPVKLSAQERAIKVREAQAAIKAYCD